MASIDERVVAMSFENQVFEQRAARTMATLTKLNTALKGMGDAKGLEDIEKSANKVTLKSPMSALEKLKAKLGGAGSGAAQGFGGIEREANKVTFETPAKAVDKLNAKMGQLSAGTTFANIEREADRVTMSGLSTAIDNISSKFSVMEGAASVAFGNITAVAAQKGAAAVKSFAFDPFKQGFDEYKTNLTSTQSILANTEQSGATLEDVNKSLSELNTYSDQTIYNFSEMAKAIGLFTSAGVDLDRSTASIKGVSNLAALSGANAEQATHVMTQLSQAISSGKVGVQDWTSLVTANMSGVRFQGALVRAAQNMGTLSKGAVEVKDAMGNVSIHGESFRDSIMGGPGKPPPWLTSDVLVETLQELTGDMTDAQLAAKGYTVAQIESIQTLARTAKLSATEVKGISQVIDVAKETIGSGWSRTFQLIFGDLGEAKKTFTSLSNFINGFINRNAEARNVVIATWKKLGGRDVLIQGFKDAFEGIMSLIRPIQVAFKQIFPPTTGKQLLEMTKNFANLAKSLRIDRGTQEDIRRTFAGIFAVFDIAKTIIGGLIGVVLDLVGVVSKGSGGFLQFTGGIGDFLVALDDAITKGGLLKGFFAGLTAILKVPLQLIVTIGKAIANMFGGDNADTTEGLKNSLDEVNDKLGPLKKVVEVVADVWDKMADAAGRAKDILEPWFDGLVTKLSGLGQAIGDALSNLKFDQVMSGLQTGIAAGLLLTLKKALGDGGVIASLTESLEGITGVLGGVTGQLEAMQTKVKAQALLSIAAAILALSAGIFILSHIDGDKLSKAMLAVAVGLGELMGAMKLMSTGLGKTGALQLPLIAAGLVGVAVAVTILAGAMKIFSTMEWEDIGKGMAGVAGSLTAVAVAMKAMPPTLPLTAVGLILIGVALNVIAAAMAAMGAMKLETAAKGVFAMVEALGGIALGVSLMPPTLPLTAAGLILMGIALASLAAAIRAMGSMDFGTLVVGMAAMMAAIAGIGLAVSLIPPTIGLSALGLLIIGQAMVVVAAAIAILGKQSIGSLVKGLVGMAGALLVLAGGLTLMAGTLPGALALMAAAAALAVLAPVLAFLGKLEWSTIFKGLAAIALVLATIGVVGLIAAPALAALGIALIPLGAGMLLVATSAKLFASAIALLGDEGQKGVAVFLTALTGFVAILPTIVLEFIKGMVGILDSVVQLAPKVILALGVIINQIIAFVVESAPKLAVAIGVLIDSILQILLENSPKLIAGGVTLLGNLLNGISQNIGQVTTKVSDIIVRFLDALRAKLPSLIEAGSKTLRAFLDGVGSRFGEIANAVGTMVSKFITAVGNQSSKIVTAAAIMMGKFVAALATFGPRLVSTGAQAISQFLQGLSVRGPAIIKQGVAAAGKLLQGIADGLVGLADIGFKAIISFLNGLEQSIRENTRPLIDAGSGVGDAIMDGIIIAFKEKGGPVRKALEAVFKLMPGWAKKVLGIKSPSTVFKEIGHYAMEGFSKGINESKPKVKKDVEDIGKNSMRGMAKGIDDNSDIVTTAALSASEKMVMGIRHHLGIHSPSEVFRDIGMNVNHGFRDGLLGSRDQVISAFESMNSTMIDKIRDLRSQVEEGNTKIEDLQQQHADKLAEIAKLRAEKKPDKDAIASAIKEEQELAKQIDAETAAVGRNQKALTASRNIRATLNKGLDDEKKKLLALKTQYDDINEQLDKAVNGPNGLKELIKAQEDAQKRYADQYNQAPDIDKLVSDALADADLTQAEREEKERKAREDAEKKSRIDQVALYKQALQEQLVATAKYQATLQKLRELGLDDATYTKLLDKGLEGQEFADQLLRSGKKGVDEINALDAQMLAKATSLAQQATKNLYDAGIAAAQGIVDGLTKKKGELEAAMESLADVMVNTIKNKLKIKSPSRIFAEIGKFATRGLAQGLQDSREVEGAVVSLGRTMTDALESAVSTNVDMSPVIRPVLDISQFQKDAQGMTDLGNVIPITAATSYTQAASTSEEVSASQQAAADAAANAAPTLNFEQNNYSPESLNSVEIYRKTRNQLGQIKSALGVPA